MTHCSSTRGDSQDAKSQHDPHDDNEHTHKPTRASPDLPSENALFLVSFFPPFSVVENRLANEVETRKSVRGRKSPAPDDGLELSKVRDSKRYLSSVSPQRFNSLMMRHMFVKGCHIVDGRKA